MAVLVVSWLITACCPLRAVADSVREDDSDGVATDLEAAGRRLLAGRPRQHAVPAATSCCNASRACRLGMAAEQDV